MGVKERGDQFRRLVRSAVDDLFDQRSPFGRLALTHVLMTAGDTLFAVSLAGSLFFSISPTAAKDKVLLYLLLTMGPFAVVAPALGPLIDRSRGARRNRGLSRRRRVRGRLQLRCGSRGAARAGGISGGGRRYRRTLILRPGSTRRLLSLTDLSLLECQYKTHHAIAVRT